ncbi:MAG: hypothetical protein ABEH43_10310 [Flavobacteriales bacterium]
MKLSLASAQNHFRGFMDELIENYVSELNHYENHNVLKDQSEEWQCAWDYGEIARVNFLTHKVWNF